MIHEDFNRGEAAGGSSNRAFGFVIAAALLAVGLWPLIHRDPLRLWAIYPAIALVAIALIVPGVLTVPNLLWTRLGHLLGRITSPIVLGVLFYLVFAPFGFAMRAFRQDPLRLSLDRSASTYWIERDPPGPAPHSLTEQF